MSADSPSTGPSHAWLQGGGEMGALIRAKDWSATPIGPVDSWSSALRMMVRFLLANRFPLLLWWGPDYVSIYNDPYRPVLGNKHPMAKGSWPVSSAARRVGFKAAPPEVWFLTKRRFPSRRRARASSAAINEQLPPSSSHLRRRNGSTVQAISGSAALSGAI
jgi:hypothetical protein